MDLKTIDISSNDWREILPQINTYSYYLIKTSKAGETTKIFCSKIRSAGYAINRDDKDMKHPHNWEFDMGHFYSPFSRSGGMDDYTINHDIVEMYEVDDSDINKEAAKRYLRKGRIILIR